MKGRYYKAYKYRIIKKMEKISVIMSAYNESTEEIKQSINSILNQTYTNFEIIFVNDNPQNKEINRAIDTVKDERLIVLNNNQNLGLVYSLNKALKYASGDFIARMDADDISVQDRFEKQINFIKKYDYDLVGGWIKKIDDDGKVISDVIKWQWKYENIKKVIRFENQLAHPTFLGKKKVFEELNGYRDILYCEDYDFIVRAINNGIIVGNCPELCLYYRVRKNSISNSNIVFQILNAEYIANDKSAVIFKQDFKNKVFTKNYIKNMGYIKKYNEYINRHDVQKLKILNKYFVYKVLKKIIKEIMLHTI